MKVYGYGRVLSVWDNPVRLVMEFLGQEEVDPDNLYIDGVVAPNRHRKMWRAVTSRLQSGDVLIVQSLAHLGVDPDELLENWELLVEEIGALVVVKDEPLLDMRNPVIISARVLARLVGHLLTCFKDTADSRKKGTPEEQGPEGAGDGGSGRKPRAIQYPEGFEDVHARYAQGLLSKAAAAKELGVTPRTFGRLADRYATALEDVAAGPAGETPRESSGADTTGA